MLISELIKKLEDFKKKHGDLPVYHTIGYVGDVEIDDIAWVRAHQCVLGNRYIDNYAKDTRDRLLDLELDMIKYAKECLDCSHCKFFSDDKCIYNSEWSSTNVLDCFRPKSHVKDSTIYHMQHYQRLLASELEKKRKWVSL